MDEEISVINKNTTNEKIKNFFINNKKSLIGSFIIIILLVFGYFGYQELKKNKKTALADKYNQIILNFDSKTDENTKKDLIDIIFKKDPTYSPLSLYFIIDNQISSSNDEINDYFDILINEINLNKEVKNLVIYKKALFNSDFETENNLINILKPIMNSESIWKSHALYLMGEYFYDKKQDLKAKEFFRQILSDKNSNENIKIEAQKRLTRDLSE